MDSICAATWNYLRLPMIQDKDRRFARNSGNFAIDENVSDKVTEYNDALVLETLDDGAKGVHLHGSVENGIDRSHQIVRHQIRLQVAGFMFLLFLASIAGQNENAFGPGIMRGLNIQILITDNE